MKEKIKSTLIAYRKCNRTLKIMKISTLLIFLCLFSLTAENVYPQQTELSLDLKNVTIKKAISEIEKTSDYVFLVTDEAQAELNKRASVQANKESIHAILDELLKDTDLKYTVVERQVSVYKNTSPKVEGVSVKITKGIEQQKKTITGRIIDEQGEPVIGANIIEQGTTNGTVTDIDGNFTLSVAENAVLHISYIGYLSQDIKTTGKNTFDIILEEDTTSLEEVVITAFGIGQKKVSTVGSIHQVSPGELKVPSSSLSSAFAGRMAGVIAVQRSGEPGADGANFWIRGKSTFSGATNPLIILDGVEINSTELNALDPEVIDSFSILKDATATALYGTRGANGVMIVTTKTGRNIPKPLINFRIEGALSQLSKVPQMVDGVTYMRAYNAAAARPGSGVQPYSEEKIQGTIDALDPYIFPNVDWYDEMFKKNSFSQRFNINIRGGGEIMDYFMSASVKHTDGNLKPRSRDFFSYNNNLEIYNYDFVNNLSVKPTSTTRISLGLNLSVRDWEGPTMSPDAIFNFSREANPVDFPVIFPADKSDYDFALWGDKAGGPYNEGYRNPVAEYVSGYRSTFTNTITATFRVEQELGMFVDGLRLAGLFSFKNNATANVNRASSYNHFQVNSYDPETLEYEIVRLGNENNTALSTTGSHSGQRNIYMQALLDYNKVFLGIHDVNAMLLYNHQQYNTNAPTSLYTSLPQRKQGIASRLSYAYDRRYLAEVNFGYNGSENFAKGKRFGFFPSVAIGYNISEEQFWENITPYISFLKLRTSWGLVGNDQTGAGRFAYLEDLLPRSSPAYVTGVAQNISYRGPVWNRYFNPDLTWEVGEKINFGIDTQLFRSLNINVDAFKETRTNIYMSRTNSMPLAYGTGNTMIYSNIGKVKNRGIDISTDYNKQFNRDFFLSFKSTFTFAQNKILEYDEPDFLKYPNLSRVGKSMNLHLGYISQGLFPDYETIENSPTQTLGYAPMPGDIWYKNLPDRDGNYDDFINSNDRVYMGYPTDPEIVYGFGPSIKYKNFDFSFFFQGTARVSLMMSNFHPFGNVNLRGVFGFIEKERWTEENQNVHAKYPRLTIQTNGNNEVASDYWLRNASFLKLKNAEIGYTYKNMRFYISGLNLLSFSSFQYWDPEMGGGNGLNYPTQRVFNLGFQMSVH